VERGNVVTAGRGGPFFLREVSHAVRVKTMAPFDVRVRRVMEQTHVDHKTATARVRTYHRELCGRIDFLFGLDWTQSENFDFVINTRDDAWQFYTDLLVAAARHPRYQPTPGSLQRLRDLSLAAHVRAALAEEPATRNLHVGVSARAGRVSLKSVVLGTSALDAAAEAARRVPGVTEVTCETVEIPPDYPGPFF
jgi:osmotically-inducible protein OsmY